MLSWVELPPTDTITDGWGKMWKNPNSSGIVVDPTTSGDRLTAAAALTQFIRSTYNKVYITIPVLFSTFDFTYSYYMHVLVSHAPF